MRPREDSEGHPRKRACAPPTAAAQAANSTLCIRRRVMVQCSCGRSGCPAHLRRGWLASMSRGPPPGCDAVEEVPLLVLASSSCRVRSIPARPANRNVRRPPEENRTRAPSSATEQNQSPFLSRGPDAAHVAGWVHTSLRGEAGLCGALALPVWAATPAQTLYATHTQTWSKIRLTLAPIWPACAVRAVVVREWAVADGCTRKRPPRTRLPDRAYKL
jgi:hypothetical protein